MSEHSVAEAKATLSSLIDKALAGEEVVITRHGTPVVELRARSTHPTRPATAVTEWLIAQRKGRPSIDITSVELLNQLYDESNQ